MVKLKIGRNDLCPCKSGKKYKKCCLNKDQGNQDHQLTGNQPIYKYKKILDVGTANPIVFRLSLGLMEIVDQTHISPEKKDSLKEVSFQLMQALVKAEQIVKPLIEEIKKLKERFAISFSDFCPELRMTQINSIKQSVILMFETLGLIFKGLSVIYDQQWDVIDFDKIKEFLIAELGEEHPLIIIFADDEAWIKKLCSLASLSALKEPIVENFSIKRDTEGKRLLKNPAFSNGDDVEHTFLSLLHNLLTFAEEMMVFSLCKFLHNSLAVYEIPEEMQDGDFQYRFRVGIKPGVSIEALDENDPILSKIKRSGIQQYHLREKVRQQKFGKVRPIIGMDFYGQKAVAIGDRMQIISKDYKTFVDFLLAYIKWCFGKRWWFEELSKPHEERHPVLKLAFAVHEYLKTNKGKENQGIFETEINSETKAYITLAYDLYILNDHKLLQNRVLNRLKNKDQFHGARYELSVIAIFIMAGFEIEFQDERDGSKKHPEFIATHKESGQKFLVEAKKRHRTQDVNDKSDQLKINGLLRKAFAKWDGISPFIIFLDLDLPPIETNPFNEPWFQELKEAPTESGGTNGDGKDIFNMIVFTNFSNAVGKDHSEIFTHIPCISRVPLIPLASTTSIENLVNILKKYGHVPSFFEE